MIGFAASVVALPLTPADPLSYAFVVVAIVAAAVPAYLVGSSPYVQKNVWTLAAIAVVASLLALPFLDADLLWRVLGVVVIVAATLAAYALGTSNRRRRRRA